MEFWQHWFDSLSPVLLVFIVVFTVKIRTILPILARKLYLNYTSNDNNQLVITSTKIMTSEKNAQLGQAREAFQMLYQISQLLGTGLDAETLTTCIKLCELGVDPEVLAHVIKEIRKIGDSNTQNTTDKLKL
ncbi:hypothetical protein O0L34_g18988 [Tuta absoluta]|nr:hypothetical protein O0L34_g18988 [Tuta absoluta]